MSNMNSPFAGVGAAKAARDSEYFRAGRYLTYLKRFTTSQNRAKVTNVIFELVVVAVLDDQAAANEPKGAHRVGESVSWLMSTVKDPTWPNLKAALKAITGVPEDQITEEFCEKLASSTQPLAGFYVEWDNRVITTKAGKPFTQVKARRAWSKAEVEGGVPAAILTSLGLDTSRCA